VPHPKPFRFGVVMARGDQGPQWLGDGPSRAAWAAKAGRVEALGYAALLVPDHFVDVLAPIPALVAAAAATTTLRLGTLVLDNDFRHPVVTAKDAATLDVLSDGRMELGLGGGWMVEEYLQAGIPFEAPGVRAGRLEESVRIVKGLFAGEPFSFAGEHYRIDALAGWPRPVQRPHPPILIGGGGPRLLRLAGREADIVGLAPRSRPEGGLDVSDIGADATDRKVGWVREAAGERFDRIELSVLSFATEVTDDRAGVAAGIAGEVGATPEMVLASPHLLIGSAEQLADDLVARRERFGISYVTIFEPALEAFAPVVARLAGT
jgi:probable F420-dependent oxidoreductase